MPLHLIVKTGPQKGYKLPLKEGLTIGRSRKSSLCLSDPKVSSLHAKVVKSQNQWVLVDNNSSNGTKLNGEPMKSFFLSIGISFQVGENIIGVSQEESQQASKENSVVDFLDAHSLESFRKREKKENWRGILSRYVGDLQPLYKDHFKSVTFFETLVQLSFLSGLQSGISWSLSYGPRIVGKSSFDLPVFEEEAPSICFEILPSPEGVILKSEKFKNVLFNGRPFSLEKVKEGDVIQIEKTSIQCHFTSSD